MNEYLHDSNAMAKVSTAFSKQSNGVFKGVIWAIDGWVIRIVKSSYYTDGIKNATTFFFKKGFYAINVQVIVDDKKRVFWLSYSNRCGSQDSSCFKDSKLYENLHKMKDLFCMKRNIF